MMDAAQTLRFVMGELWEHEAESERQGGVRITFCGRCEQYGGSPAPHANWTDVPHFDSCAYAKAAEALGFERIALPPEQAQGQQNEGAES